MRRLLHEHLNHLQLSIKIYSKNYQQVNFQSMKLLVYGGNKMEDHSKNMKTILEMIERGELSPEDGYHLIEQLENTQSQSGDFQSVVLTKPGHIEDLQLKTSP